MEGLASRISAGLIEFFPGFCLVSALCSPTAGSGSSKNPHDVSPQQLLCRNRLPNIQVTGPVEGWSPELFYTCHFPIGRHLDLTPRANYGGGVGGGGPMVSGD